MLQEIKFWNTNVSVWHMLAGALSCFISMTAPEMVGVHVHTKEIGDIFN
jgi:hypothetical protein